MEIREKIENDFKQALKNKDQVVVSTLRMLKAAIYNKQIEKKGEQLETAEVVKIIAKQLQQHQESIEQFKKGNRADLVEKETKELEVLKVYMPAQLSAEQVAEVVKKVIADSGVKDQKGFGQVMKLVMAELKGKAGGKLISQTVNQQLTG